MKSVRLQLLVTLLATVVAAGGHRDVAALLIAGGADVNARDNDGKTPLQIAVEKEEDVIADFLRAHGARE